MSKGYYPANQFDTVGIGPHGGTYVTIKNDICEHYINKEQRWIPHVVPSVDHPATVGDMITLGPVLSEQLGFSIAFVSGIRTLMRSKKGSWVRQVEILGLPCQWFNINRFGEYNPQITCSDFDRHKGTLLQVITKPTSILNSISK